jgi:hypothetical protein
MQLNSTIMQITMVRVPVVSTSRISSITARPPQHQHVRTCLHGRPCLCGNVGAEERRGHMRGSELRDAAIARAVLLCTHTRVEEPLKQRDKQTKQKRDKQQTKEKNEHNTNKTTNKQTNKQKHQQANKKTQKNYH